MPRGKYDRTVDHCLKISEGCKRAWAEVPQDHPRRLAPKKATTRFIAGRLANKIRTILKKK